MSRKEDRMAIKLEGWEEHECLGGTQPPAQDLCTSKETRENMRLDEMQGPQV